MTLTLVVILVSGFVATTAMTAFSYALSRGKAEQFREPELLNSLLARSEVITLRPSRNSPWGWLLHYGIGWTFAAIFLAVWAYTAWSPGLLSGSAMGLAAGIVGVGGWQTMLTLSGSPPEIPLKRFFLHLLVAHVLFGISAALVVSMLR